MNCEQAQRLILPSAIITACGVVRNTIRLQTTFEYPGNEFVDIFVLPQADAQDPLILTDGGMTISQLLGFGLDIDGTKRRREFVKGICDQLDIRRRGGEFTVTVREPVENEF